MAPNFLLTKYFFPLAEPIALSSHLNFSIDNPRTNAEVSYTRKYLTDQYEAGILPVLPPHSKEDIITLEMVVKSFRDAYSKENEYVKGFFKGYKRKFLFDYLARMWCVARFNDEGEVARIDKQYQEMKEKGVRGLVILDNENPILKNSQSLVNYCDLLALLSHTEGSDYFGRDIIMDPDQLTQRVLLQNFTHHLVMLCSVNHDYVSRPEYSDELSWIFSWLFGSKHILRAASLLESAFKDGQVEKLLYVGNLLGIANRTPDIRIRLLILTSIIELLVTRNPDTSRFNVEDSISKQFQLKASVLIYLNNKTQSIDSVKARLKAIYEQRSNIAHGNFGKTGSDKKTLPKKDGQEEYFSDLVVDLYTYVRAILEEYLKDVKFVEFIKAG